MLKLFERLKANPWIRLFGEAGAMTWGVAIDAMRYLRRASLGGPNVTLGKIEGRIAVLHHSIEKGLALPSSRLGFGKRNIATLIALTRRLINEYGKTQTAHDAIEVLTAYQAAQLPEQKNSDIAQFLDEMRTEHIHGDRGGVKWIERDAYFAQANINAQAFMQSRRSIREFSDAAVDVTLIQRSVEAARFTPSVCNRQGWGVTVLTRRPDVLRALELQNGNLGFRNHIPLVLVVTSHVDRFLSFRERNQPWIDGGMFAMSLLYALHANGLATCPLNMATSPREDLAFRSALNIPDHNLIVMLIAVGHAPGKFRLPHSPKRPINEILEIR